MIWLLFLLAGSLAACGGPATETAAPPSATVPARPTRTPPPSATPAYTATVPAEEKAARSGQPLPVQQNDLFSTSGECVICHTNMQDDTGAEVSIDAYWRATMMANAARDPYWLATVRSEMIANPDLAQTDRKSTRLNSSHTDIYRMPSSA